LLAEGLEAVGRVAYLLEGANFLTGRHREIVLTTLPDTWTSQALPAIFVRALLLRWCGP
jgi:hypothetical protein